MMTGMPRVVVITTGGTIATGSAADGVLRPVHPGADLLGGVAARTGTEIEVVDLMSVDSSRLTPTDWVKIGAAVERTVADGADGVVITHGTDTMEETALWLELTYDGEAPVVLTGSARPADDPAPDGPVNLSEALTVAASPKARGLGVLMSFGGAVFTPLGTTKQGGAAVFGGTPPVAGVSGRAFLERTGKDRPYLGSVASVPRVDIAVAYPGADGVAIDAFAAAGASGMVVEAMGTGNAGDAIVEAVARVCHLGVVVAVTSRVPGGTRAAYGPGYDLVEAGAIMVPRLRASQSRVLMTVALGVGLPVGEVIDRWG